MRLVFLFSSLLCLLLLSSCGCREHPSNSYRKYGGSSFRPGTSEDFVVTAGDEVFFDTSSNYLDEESKFIIKRQAEWLKSYSDTFVVIEGHCDFRGTASYNMSLGARRAQSVHDYLVSLGIEKRRLRVISYGKERLKVLGESPEHMRLNRRAALVVIDAFDQYEKN